MTTPSKVSGLQVTPPWDSETLDSESLDSETLGHFRDLDCLSERIVTVFIGLFEFWTRCYVSITGCKYKGMCVVWECVSVCLCVSVSVWVVYVWFGICLFGGSGGGFYNQVIWHQIHIFDQLSDVFWWYDDMWWYVMILRSFCYLCYIPRSISYDLRSYHTPLSRHRRHSKYQIYAKSKNWYFKDFSVLDILHL